MGAGAGAIMGATMGAISGAIAATATSFSQFPGMTPMQASDTLSCRCFHIFGPLQRYAASQCGLALLSFDLLWEAHSSQLLQAQNHGEGQR